MKMHLNHSQITPCGTCLTMFASPFGLGTNHPSVQGIDLRHNRHFEQNDGNFENSKASRGKNIKPGLVLAPNNHGSRDTEFWEFIL